MASTRCGRQWPGAVHDEFTERIEDKTKEDQPEVYARILKYYSPGEAERYYDYEINDGVHRDFYDARDIEWLGILKYGLDGDLMSWIRDVNIFPAHLKVRGALKVPTVWYNLAVLGILIAVFHSLTIWKLRKL